MHNRKTLAIALAISLSAIPGFAAETGGSESGGGQNSVVCFANSTIPYEIRNPQSPRFGQILDSEISGGLVTSIESYDLYEARMPRGLERAETSIIGIGEQERIRDYAEKIARRYEPYIPNVTKLIRRGAAIFSDDKILMRPAGIKRIKDENDVGYIDASRCVVATMAAQYKAGNEDQLQLDSRIFVHPLHSRLSQGVLFLHESIYHGARNLEQQKDSRATRAAVAALINAAPRDGAQILEYLKKLDLPYVNQGDNIFSSLAVEAMTGKKYQRTMERIKSRIKAENAVLAKSYDAWYGHYMGGNTEFRGFGVGKIESSREDWVGDKFEIRSLLQFPESDWKNEANYTCQSRRDPVSGCVAALQGVARAAKRVEKKMTRIAVEEFLRLAQEEIFPKFEQLTQFDFELRERAKAIVTEAVLHGKLTSSDFNDAEFGFRTTEAYPLDKPLQALEFLIP